MYYSLINPQFWLYGLLFVLAAIISCYLPGWLILRKASLTSKLTETAAATVLGISLWAAQGYTFGYAQYRWLSYVYLICVLLLGWKSRAELLTTVKALKKEVQAIPFVELCAVVIACIFQLYAHIGSGLLSGKGVSINFVNSADGMLHLGYIDSMTRHFPPLEPGLAGALLTNYHYWSDLVFAEFARVWGLPVIHLFFQYMPVLLVVTSTVLFVQVLRWLKGDTSTILVGLFLFTFGADAAFIFSLYFNRVWGANIPALDTGVSFIFNMPQVFSRMVFLAALICFLQWLKNKKAAALWSMIFLAASLFGLKIYYGIYFVTGLGFFSLYLFGKNIFKSFISTIVANKSLLLGWGVLTVLVAVIYLPNNKGAGGLLYEPLAWPKVFLSAEHFNYRDWWLRMQVYEEAGNTRNIFIYNTIAIAITLLSIYGIRIIGALPLKKDFIQYPKELLIFLVPTNVLFIIVGLTFFQVSGGLNIYNFLIVPILSFNIFAAITIGMIKDSFYKTLVIAVVVALTAPRTVLQLKEFFSVYYSNRPSQVISHEELELLSYIRSNSPSDAVIQADPKNQYEFVTPYVAFFSGRTTYLGGRKLLETHNQPIVERVEYVDKVFKDLTPSALAQQMNSRDIKYLYITDPGIKEAIVSLTTASSEEIVIVAQNEAGIIVTAK